MVQIADPRTLIVQVRSTWGGSWTTISYLEPIAATLATSPGISECRFRYAYGDIKREDGDDFTTYNSLQNLGGYYVQVLDATLGVNPARLFIGVLQREMIRPLHRADGDPESGDQELVAFGLEHLLDRIPVFETIIEKANTKTVVGTVVAINRRSRRGLTAFGNRSSGTYPGNGAVSGEQAHVFTRDGVSWSELDFLRYLVHMLPIGDVPFEIVGQTGPLEGRTVDFLNPEGLTARQILDRLVDRRRGLVWAVRYDEANDRGEIHIRSIFDTPVSLGTVTIPANDDDVSIVTDDEDERATDVEIHIDASQRYDWIFVRGAPIKSCFSVSVPDETLEQGWSAAQQTAYNTPDGAADADAADRIRRESDELRSVYSVFRIPTEWDYFAGDGEGGVKENANPLINGNGSLDIAQQNSTLNFGRLLLRSLPIAKAWDDATGEVEYREPFVLVKDPDGFWGYVDRQGDQYPSGHVRMLDVDLGFEVRMSVNHELASADFDAETNTPAVFDWREMIATVAVELDRHLEIIVAAGSATPLAAGQQPTGRVLVIDVPDAELWWLTPGTVLDVQSGALVRSAATGLDAILRDDTARLREIAAVAAGWYGRDRKAVSVTREGLRVDIDPGAMLQTVTGGFGRETIKSIVTSIGYDFQQFTTTINSDFLELELSSLAA